MLADDDRGMDRPPQPLGNLHRFTAQHGDELVAAEPRQHVVLTQHRSQPVGDDLDQVVADLVTEAVVDHLELVEVDEQHDHVVEVGDRQTILEDVHQIGPVRQPGQFVVAGRVAQLLGRSTLLGDVFDVGDRQHHPVVLGRGHPCTGPDELAVAASVALIDPERIDDPQLEPGTMRLGRTDIVGMGELAQRTSDQLVHLATQHFRQRLVGVDDATVVQAHQRHPGRRRLERLMEPAPRLVECPGLLLALGDVAEPHDEATGLVEHRAVAWEMERCLDHHATGRPAVHLDLDRVDLVALEGALDGRSQLHLFVTVGVFEQVTVDHLLAGQIEQCQCCRIGAVHDVIGIHQQHGLGQLVEQTPHLTLRGLDGLQLATHPFGLPTVVPDAGEQHRDRQHTQADHQQILRCAHASRLDPRHGRERR